ncbi:MAG: pyridoxamine 5'-phosphate oxidase [Planctomycetota bacterium]
MDSRQFEHLRIHYGDRELGIGDLPPDPMALFDDWLAAATAAGVSEPNGMALATVDADGAPSCRIVLLKTVDAQGFRFFTHFDSDKGRHLARDPRAALTFWWSLPTARQVRVVGDVSRLPEVDADAYFSTRPRASQLAASVSPQSQPIASRGELEAKVNALAERLGSAPVPRPGDWGGYLVRPRTFEFWQGRDHRLHDRFRYSHGSPWRIERLAP